MRMLSNAWAPASARANTSLRGHAGLARRKRRNAFAKWATALSMTEEPLERPAVTDAGLA